MRTHGVRNAVHVKGCYITNLKVSCSIWHIFVKKEGFGGGWDGESFFFQFCLVYFCLLVFSPYATVVLLKKKDNIKI